MFSRWIDEEEICYIMGEGGSYNSLLTSMSLKYLVHWVHLRLKTTKTKWQPERVAGKKGSCVHQCLGEKLCLSQFLNLQRTPENTLTLRQHKQLPLLLMTNISYRIMVKKCCCFSEAIELTHLFVLMWCATQLSYGAFVFYI